MFLCSQSYPAIRIYHFPPLYNAGERCGFGQIAVDSTSTFQRAGNSQFFRVRCSRSFHRVSTCSLISPLVTGAPPFKLISRLAAIQARLSFCGFVRLFSFNVGRTARSIRKSLGSWFEIAESETSCFLGLGTSGPCVCMIYLARTIVAAFCFP